MALLFKPQKHWYITCQGGLHRASIGRPDWHRRWSCSASTAPGQGAALYPLQAVGWMRGRQIFCGVMHFSCGWPDWHQTWYSSPDTNLVESCVCLVLQACMVQLRYLNDRGWKKSSFLGGFLHLWCIAAKNWVPQTDWQTHYLYYIMWLFLGIIPLLSLPTTSDIFLVPSMHLSLIQEYHWKCQQLLSNQSKDNQED